MNFCSQCGQGNKEDAAFCVQCGAPLQQEGQGEQAAGPPAEGAPQGAPVPGSPPPGAPGPGGPPPGAPPPQGVTPPTSYYPQSVRPVPTDGMAIASLVLSISSFIFCPFFAAILGLIFGYLSLGQIAESRGALGGEPLARAGIIIGWIHIGLVILAAVLILILVLVGVIATH